MLKNLTGGGVNPYKSTHYKDVFRFIPAREFFPSARHTSIRRHVSAGLQKHTFFPYVIFHPLCNMPQGLRAASQSSRIASHSSRVGLQGLRVAPQGSRVAPQDLRVAPQSLRVAPQSLCVAPQSLCVGTQSLCVGTQNLCAGTQNLCAGVQICRIKSWFSIIPNEIKQPGIFVKQGSASSFALAGRAESGLLRSPCTHRPMIFFLSQIFILYFLTFKKGGFYAL
jgi:hypothetical protein